MWQETRPFVHPNTGILMVDDITLKRTRARGTVTSLNAATTSFVLTVQDADDFQPTGGTITVKTDATTKFGKSMRQQGTFADIAVGTIVEANGSFDTT